MCGQVLYPAAILNTSGHPEAARAFLDFLTGDTGDAVFCPLMAAQCYFAQNFPKKFVPIAQFRLDIYPFIRYSNCRCKGL